MLDERFLTDLHKRMFVRGWRWAGKFRHTERNVGVAPYRIATDLRQLLDDSRYWIEHATYPPDEICVRFHHRLVAIHPFPNGNGRHAPCNKAGPLCSRGQLQETVGIFYSATRRRPVAALKI